MNSPLSPLPPMIGGLPALRRWEAAWKDEDMRKKLTKTQNDLLTLLRAMRAEADRTEADADAHAIGGLTDRERFGRGATWCRHYKELVWHVMVGGKLVQYRASHVRPETFHVLEDAGLAERRGMRVRAKIS